jgi:hypothetical protein
MLGLYNKSIFTIFFKKMPKNAINLSGFAIFWANIDELAKSRHSGENRSPGTLQLIEKTGFRLSPE